MANYIIGTSFHFDNVNDQSVLMESLLNILEDKAQAKVIHQEKDSWFVSVDLTYNQLMTFAVKRLGITPDQFLARVKQVTNNV